MLKPIPLEEEPCVVTRGQVLDVPNQMARLYTSLPRVKYKGEVGEWLTARVASIVVDKFDRWHTPDPLHPPEMVKLCRIFPIPLDAFRNSNASAWEYLPLDGADLGIADPCREGDWVLTGRYYQPPVLDDILAIPVEANIDQHEFYLREGMRRMWLGWDAVEAAIMGAGDDEDLYLARSPRDWLTRRHTMVDEQGIEHLAFPLTDIALLDLYDVRRKVICATETQAVKIRDLLAKPTWAVPELMVAN
jgi:hypothetical protein